MACVLIAKLVGDSAPVDLLNGAEKCAPPNIRVGTSEFRAWNSWTAGHFTPPAGVVIEIRCDPCETLPGLSPLLTILRPHDTASHPPGRVPRKPFIQ